MDIHYEILDACRAATGVLALEFAEMVPVAETVERGAFGGLTDSAGLAGAVNAVEQEIVAEVGEVSAKLGAVELGLDTVQSNVLGLETHEPV